MINSDFMERAQFRGEKAQEAADELKKVLETSAITQTPELVPETRTLLKSKAVKPLHF